MDYIGEEMIVVIYGNNITKNTYEALEASDIHSYLKPGFSVSIKPNLVVSRPASEGATTHPEVVEGIILFLKDNGINDINVIESSWVGDSTKRAFKNCGYEELSKRHGVPLLDLKSDSYTVREFGGYKIKICDAALDTDFLINVPVLKAHCQTNLTCCMKNLKGCIPDDEKRRFHTLGKHKPVAALNGLLKTGYCVVDGICGDLSFEEGGNPMETNMIIAGQNPLLVDSYCAELIGYHPHEVEYLSHGQRAGIGEFYSEKTKIVELNAGNKPLTRVKSNRHAERYKNIIHEDAACSACYSSLIYALYNLGGRVAVDGKIKIGQGFKGKSGTGTGIGNCTCGFTKNVLGCPPKATDIIGFFEK
jgi:uncharacterized protein (DUF362 family)